MFATFLSFSLVMTPDIFFFYKLRGEKQKAAVCGGTIKTEFWMAPQPPALLTELHRRSSAILLRCLWSGRALGVRKSELRYALS